MNEHVTFDVIIATKDRHKSASILINQILSCRPQPRKIILIDSSNKNEFHDIKNNKFEYHHSSRKNQPFQRYLGFKKSNADILVFLDDDMRINNKKCFSEILSFYKDKSIIGVQPNFSYKNNFLDHEIPKSKLKYMAKKNYILNFLKGLSGNPEINEGAFSYAGLKGKKPRNLKQVEWFYGPIFSARRNALYFNFNFNLFKIYEKNLGKGEDAILGHTLSKKGKILFMEKKNFSHEDTGNSSYSRSIYDFSKRVAYSRLYLTLEYCRLNQVNSFYGILRCNQYLVGRIVVLFLNQLLNFKINRNKQIYGFVVGLVLSNIHFFSISKVDLKEPKC